MPPESRIIEIEVISHCMNLFQFICDAVLGIANVMKFQLLYFR